MLYGWDLISIEASTEGLRLRWYVPIYWKAAFIPWKDIWIRHRNYALADRLELGFLGCTEVSFKMSASVIRRLREDARVRVPEECFV